MPDHEPSFPSSKEICKARIFNALRKQRFEEVLIPPTWDEVRDTIAWAWRWRGSRYGSIVLQYFPDPTTNAFTRPENQWFGLHYDLRKEEDGIGLNEPVPIIPETGHERLTRMQLNDAPIVVLLPEDITAVYKQDSR